MVWFTLDCLYSIHSIAAVQPLMCTRIGFYSQMIAITSVLCKPNIRLDEKPHQHERLDKMTFANNIFNQQVFLCSRLFTNLLSSIEMDLLNEEFDVMDNINQLNIDNYIINDFLPINRGMKRKYTVRRRIDPFEEYDEPDFRRRYRLSKEQTRRLFQLIDGNNTLEPMVI